MNGAPVNSPSPRRRVLLVDDSDVVRAAVGAALREAGYEVDDAEDGARAQSLLQTGSYDVVITDLQMPGVDGFGVLEGVKRRDPTGEVVVFTGTYADDSESIIRALRLGASDFLVKSACGPQQVVWSAERAVERRRQREQLTAAQERYRDLFDRIPIGVYRTTPDGRFIDANPAFTAILGYPDRATLLAAKVLDCFETPDDHRSWRERLEREGVSSGTVLRMRRFDGTLLWVEDSARLVRGDGGDALYYEGALQDVTARIQAEAARRQAETQYRELVEWIQAIVWRADARTFRFSFVSPEAEHVLGYPARLWLEDPSFWREHVHPDDREWVFSRCAQATTECRDHELEYRMMAADGRIVWLKDLVRVVLENGQPKELVGVMIDVTRRKLLEEELRQAQKMEAFGQLAGGVAHDFNNILGVIEGYGDLLLKDMAPADPRRVRVEHIRGAADRGAALTRQLLAFSRKQILQPRILDFTAVVSGIEPMLRRVIGEDIQLTTAFEERLRCVHADPSQLEQVILNLVVNARDAMPSGGKLLIETANADIDESYASFHPGVQPGSYAVLAVSDTGTGMDGPTLAHIFEPFFSTKEPDKGTGLGLATVYGIVQQSGGHIAVYSEPGHGSAFRVYLPQAVQEEGAQPAVPASAEPASPVARGCETILVVEDDQGMREITRDLLEEGGYTVLEGANPELALSLVRSCGDPIHLLLTDVVMPGMSGLELAVQLLAWLPAVKVLYMSGYPKEIVGHHHRDLEPEAFIQKPFAAESLLRKVRETLDGG